jgi:HK97 family phage major capsid protein
MAEQVDLKEVLGEELVTRIETLEGKAQETIQRIKDGGADADVEALKSDLAKTNDELQPLLADRKDRLHEMEMKALAERADSLETALAELRKPGSDFKFSGGAPSNETEGKAVEFYGDGQEQRGKHSWYADMAASARGDRDAQRRVAEVQDELEGKAAMTEGTGSAGGFLVPDQISRDLLELRQANAVVRPLLSSVPVTSDVLRMTAVTGGLTAGWVAELGAKPEAELTFAEVTASVFTIAGISVASNQLIRDSIHSIDRLINSDLAKKIRNVEELGFIDGTGSGQPTGILGTSGVNAITYTDASATVPELLDAVVDAITAVYTNFLGAPNAILMHPRTWAFIVKGREATSPSTYFIGAGSTAFGRRGNDPLPGYGSAALPRGELFGLPVYTTPNMPTNKGAGTNESRIIVGDFSEGLVLDREGIQFDQSSHVYFTSNQTVFRGEEALGFTAARYPKAFSVISGTGLAGI